MKRKGGGGFTQDAYDADYHKFFEFIIRWRIKLCKGKVYYCYEPNSVGIFTNTELF